jgi:hypothetical protein
MLWRSRGLWLGFLAIGLIYAIYAGLWKDGPSRWLDSRVYYVAGAALDSGKSPCNPTSYREAWQQATGKDITYSASGGLPLIPSMGYFLATLGKAPWEIAKWVFDIFSLVFGLGGVIYFLHKLDRERHAGTFTEPRALIAATGVCFISGVPAALFLGQTSLITMTGILGTMYYSIKGKPIAAAFFLYFAVFKMQLALLPLFYLVIFGIFRPLLAGVAVILVSSGWTLYTLWATNLMQDFAGAAQAYMTISANQPPQVTGLHSLIISVGGESSKLVWLIMALAVVAGPVIAMRIKNNISIRSTLIAGYGELWFLPFVATGVFIQMKPYDSIIFAPVLYWLLRRGSWNYVLYIPGIVLAVRPELPAILFGRHFDSILLLQSQVTTIACIYLLLCLMWRLVRCPKDSMVETKAC